MIILKYFIYFVPKTIFNWLFFKHKKFNNYKYSKCFQYFKADLQIGWIKIFKPNMSNKELDQKIKDLKDMYIK